MNPSRSSVLPRRAFLRGIAVAGGAIALPVLSQQRASCSTRVAAGDTAPSSTGAAGVPANVNERDLREVTDNILCEGGCGKTVYLGELTDACPIAMKMKLEAAASLAQGKTPQQTLDQFAAEFGEGVLASPTRSGFNLLAWLVPLAGLGLGGASIVVALRNWKHAQLAIEQVAPETDAAMLSRIDDEVKKVL